MRELEPQKGIEEVRLGPLLRRQWMEAGRAGRGVVPLSRARAGSFFLCPTGFLYLGPCPQSPCKSLSRWLSVSWPSMEALPEPTVRVPFPGIRRN